MGKKIVINLSGVEVTDVPKLEGEKYRIKNWRIKYVDVRKTEKVVEYVDTLIDTITRNYKDYDEIEFINFRSPFIATIFIIRYKTKIGRYPIIRYAYKHNKKKYRYSFPVDLENIALCG